MIVQRRFIAIRLCLLVWAILLGACQQEVTPTAASPAVAPPLEQELQPESDGPVAAPAESNDPAPVPEQTPIAAEPPRPLDLSRPEPIISLWRPELDFKATKTRLLPRLFETNKKKKTKAVSLSVMPLRDEYVESFMDSVEGAEVRVKIQTR